MNTSTARAILFCVLSAWLLSGADSKSIFDDSEELDEGVSSPKRELDLTNEGQRYQQDSSVLGGENSAESEAETNKEKQSRVTPQEFLSTNGMGIKTFCYDSICAKSMYRCGAHYYYYQHDPYCSNIWKTYSCKRCQRY